MKEDSSSVEDNCFLTSNTAICNGIMRSEREHRPAHYLLKIKSYSTLAASNKLARYESNEFEAGGYNWRMIVYHRETSEANRDGHISLYLAIAKTEELPPGWEVWVDFKFFVHDQILDKYLVIQDVEKPLKRFYPAKTEWGFEELLPMDAFKDVGNGYLVDDCSAFGAEVFVIQCSGNWECVSTPAEDDIYTWKLKKFSQFGEQSCSSKSFTIGGVKWKLRAYPRGDIRCPKNEFLSIYLYLDEVGSTISKKKWYVEYTVRVKDQELTLTSKSGASWFSHSDKSWGFSKFMSLKKIEETSASYQKDTLIIECQITFLTEFEDFKQ